MIKKITKENNFKIFFIISIVLFFMLDLNNYDALAAYSCNLERFFDKNDPLYIFIGELLRYFAFGMMIIFSIYSFFKEKNNAKKIVIFLCVLFLALLLFLLYASINLPNTRILMILILIPVGSLIFFEKELIKKGSAIFIMIFFIFFVVGIFLPLNKEEAIDRNILKNNKSVTKECVSINGQTRESGCGTNYCELPSNDYGKECSDDFECEKFCEIENEENIIKIFNQNYTNLKCEEIFNEDVESCRYKSIKYDDWYQKTGIEIKGKCSKYYHESAKKNCSSIYTNGISVQGDILMVNDGSCSYY